MNQQFKLTFNLEDKDSELYHKYGEKAVELGSQGNYDEAIKLLDKVLAKKQKTEFALLMKANYYFNKVNEELELNEPTTPEEIPLVKKQASKIKKDLNECLNLVEKVLKINPKNEGAKQIKKFIKDNSMKEVENLLKTIDKTKNNTNNSNKLKVNLLCPYCNSQNTQEVIKTEGEYNCPKCNRTFKSIVGIVRGARGLGGYVAHQVVIRIEKIEGGGDTISYPSSYQGVEARAKDLIAVTYKKGLFGGYGIKPKILQNFSIGQYFSKL
ncbi:hypothetical protein DRN73_10195 [Candidatus Pacearchaeota archaeon]|nr:MAG: hypothetical protein DRN73_10195 [Candidatus Pacearchaeota archaeon]